MNYVIVEHICVCYKNWMQQFNNLQKIFIYSSELTKHSMEIALVLHSDLPMWCVLCADFTNASGRCRLHSWCTERRLCCTDGNLQMKTP